jgi:hypothetical protein
MTGYKAELDTELDRRGKVEEPAGKVEGVKYWSRPGRYKGMFVVTKNNVVESVSLDLYQSWVGQSWKDRDSDWYEISKDEYKAAKQPKPTERPEIEPEPWVKVAGMAFVGKSDLVNAIDQLQRRHDALENSLGLIRGVIMKMGDALANRLEAVERRGK